MLQSFGADNTRENPQEMLFWLYKAHLESSIDIKEPLTPKIIPQIHPQFTIHCLLTFNSVTLILQFTTLKKKIDIKQTSKTFNFGFY